MDTHLGVAPCPRRREGRREAARECCWGRHSCEEPAGSEQVDLALPLPLAPRGRHKWAS